MKFRRISKQELESTFSVSSSQKEEASTNNSKADKTSIAGGLDISDDDKEESIISPSSHVKEDTEIPSNKDYDGDYIEEDTTPVEQTGYRKLDIPNPAFLLNLYDPSFRESQYELYPWQLKINEDVGLVKPTLLKPYKFVLCAANGSGKDAFFIAPFAVWFALTKIKSRCIITSSSGQQLTAQTEGYIKEMAKKINDFHEMEVFRIRQRYIYCRLTGSEIRLFATDEEGKAEGYHPMEANAEMAIIINEAKNVDKKIYRALRRCTGYNYWIEVSTPGQPTGDFHKHFTTWSNTFHVDTFMCPKHLSDDEREADKLEYGESSAIYRSKHLALFTSESGECIIPIEVVDRLKTLAKTNVIGWEHKVWPIRIGIDLAAGGDETVICFCRGNRRIKQIEFRDKDTVVTVARIHEELLNMSIVREHEHIYADDGGIGKGIIDHLIDRGWKINRINNQSPARDKKRYINRGAEMWYRVKRIVEENLFLFDFEDEKFYEQLSSRFYKQQSTQGRIALESKKEAKANGRPSPDRADAFILTFVGLNIDDFLVSGHKVDSKDANKVVLRNNDEVQTWHDDQRYMNYQQMNGEGSRGNGKKAYGSLSCILNRIKPRNKMREDYRETLNN